MRTVLRVLLVALVVAVGVLSTFPELAHAVPHASAIVHGLVLAAPPLILPMDIRTLPYQQLQAKTRPVDPNLPEALPDVLYDTQTYLAAGSVHLDFFVATNADKSLSNMEQAGTLPAPQYFDVYRIFCDFLAAPSATVADTAAGVVNDVELVLKSARARLTYTSKNKTLGPIPLTFFGSSGLMRAGFDTGRAAAAGAVIQQVQGIDNGGFPVNGAITLRSQSTFAIGLDFVAGVAISANLLIRVSMLGVRYREIG